MDITNDLKVTLDRIYELRKRIGFRNHGQYLANHENELERWSKLQQALIKISEDVEHNMIVLLNKIAKGGTRKNE